VRSLRHGGPFQLLSSDRPHRCRNTAIHCRRTNHATGSASIIIIIIIIIIYSLKIGAGQQGRISGTYNCPLYKIKCRNIKYRELQKTRSQSQHSTLPIQILSSFYLPSNTTVCTSTSIQFRRAWQQSPTRTLTAAPKRLIKQLLGTCYTHAMRFRKFILFIYLYLFIITDKGPEGH